MFEVSFDGLKGITAPAEANVYLIYPEALKTTCTVNDLRAWTVFPFPTTVFSFDGFLIFSFFLEFQYSL
jgi:hypothetical protein